MADPEQAPQVTLPQLPPPPYEPTPEEEAYIEACGQTIVAGLDAADSAAATSSAAEYAKFAAGVKDLVLALQALKAGPQADTNLGH